MFRKSLLVEHVHNAAWKLTVEIPNRRSLRHTGPSKRKPKISSPKNRIDTVTG